MSYTVKNNYDRVIYTCHTNVGLMLDHRLRRWPSIKPILVRIFVIAGVVINRVESKFRRKCDVILV